MFSVLQTLLLISSAHASTSFPQVIQSELEMDAAPGCDLCHEGAPGVGTATTLFAETLIGRGLVGGSDEALVLAMAAIEGEGADSDGDGISDIDELVAGTNPNSALTISPEYGCIGSTAPESRRGWGMLGGLFVFLGVWGRSRRWGSPEYR